jgi:hypothetical protein
MIGAHSRRETNPAYFWRAWLPCFLLFGFVMGLWALASPLASAADEPTTVIRAAAAVRGQLVGTPVSPAVANASVGTQVSIPKTFRDTDACFAFHPTRSAACAAGRPTSSRTVGNTTTAVGRYPPLYYLIVGLPSYLPGGSSAIYFMRMAAVSVNAAMLALAFYAIRRWSRSQIILLGFAFAVSPMVLFYSAVINPSGLELCSAVCLWTAGTIWVVDHSGRPPMGLLWVVTVSAAVLVQSRPASPVWPLVTAIVLIPLLWRAHPLRRMPALLRALHLRRELWPMLVILVGSYAFALAWLLIVHSFRMVGGNFPAPGTPLRTLTIQSIKYMPGYLEQAVGVLGWLDTFLPIAVIHFWYAGVVGLLVIGLALSGAGGRLSIFIGMLLCFLVPVVGTLADVHKHGFTSQGRYFLPLFVCLPIVAAALIGRSVRDRQITVAPIVRRMLFRLVLLAIAIGQIVAFGTALRRYLVGVNGPIFPTTHISGAWRPPLPGVWLDVLGVLGVGALYWYLGRPVPENRAVEVAPADLDQGELGSSVGR